ncbi:uncharacterized protein LOC121764202 [Salvia splendens]|uniref:uncharacterized protein LOC121764202 n=1 Tax=Salvia splendens TaxID=180675 RepID=UPI001C275F7A|nr:uncharacterized protein LOC121764202 [Salvia splendens]
MVKDNRISVLAIIEPLIKAKPDVYSRLFGMKFKGANKKGQIWVFVKEDIELDGWDDSDQVLHGRYVSPSLSVPIFMSVVYGKCSREGRVEIWDKLREPASKLDGSPWLVGGNFNIFVSEEERQGSVRRQGRKAREMSDLAETISDCQLLDVGADGPKFTWARGNTFERLVRVLLSEGWANVFECTRVTNLPRILSDHCPLLINCRLPGPRIKPSFRFQNMWVRHPLFLKEVERCWREETGTSGMVNVQLKLSRLKKSLRIWNRVVFGNIFERLGKAEAEAKEASEKFEQNPTPALRVEMNKAIAKFLARLKMEEDFWRQKAAIKWVAEGERNTRYFQGWVKQKRVKARIHMIEEGERVLTDDADIRNSTEMFFKELLTEDVGLLGEPDLEIIPSLTPHVNMNRLEEGGFG